MTPDRPEPTPKPARKRKSDAAQGGMVATVVLLFLVVFTAIFVALS